MKVLISWIYQNKLAINPFDRWVSFFIYCREANYLSSAYQVHASNCRRALFLFKYKDHDCFFYIDYDNLTYVWPVITAIDSELKTCSSSEAVLSKHTSNCFSSHCSKRSCNLDVIHSHQSTIKRLPSVETYEDTLYRKSWSRPLSCGFIYSRVSCSSFLWITLRISDSLDKKDYVRQDVENLLFTICVTQAPSLKGIGAAWEDVEIVCKGWRGFEGSINLTVFVLVTEING